MGVFRHVDQEIARSSLVDHNVIHANGTPAFANWAQSQTLHVAAMYTNPCRWWIRTALFQDFRRHMATLPNIRLYVAEIAFGDRPFEVTTANNPDDFQWRTRHELWHKENALNLVIQRFAPGWEYGAYVDGDFNFSRHDIGLETIQMLQHYDWVQMFKQYSDLGPDNQILATRPGFAYSYLNGVDINGKPNPNNYGWPGSPGGAWAFRRGAYAACGELLDTCILGSGDHHMALGLVGWDREHPDTHKCSDAYAKSIYVWKRRAWDVVRGNIGYVNAHMTHGFHGPRNKRGYEWRWKILRDHNFDPYADIYKDSQGLYQLTREKHKLRDEIRQYFRSRNEDDLRIG